MDHGNTVHVWVHVCVSAHACAHRAGADFALERFVDFVFQNFPALSVICVRMWLYRLLHVFAAMGGKVPPWSLLPLPSTETPSKLSKLRTISTALPL